MNDKTLYFFIINLMKEKIGVKRLLGIELLRFLLCFWIVLFHCAKIKKIHRKYFWRLFHVPTFFVISFYFYYPILHKRTIVKIKLRFQRLLIPYILWPIFLFLLYNIRIMLQKSGKKISLKDLFIQILVGQGFHDIFWFQFNLIFLSLVLLIISFLYKNFFIPILHFLTLISLYMHYSCINYNIFKFRKFKRSLGTLIEVFPLANIGCIYNYLNLLLYSNNFPSYIKLIFFIYIYFLFEYDVFILPHGFRYPNVILNILASTILFLFFGSLHLDKSKVDIIINIITKYTGGIYYIHIIVRRNLEVILIFLKKELIFLLLLFILFLMEYVLLAPNF